MSRIGKKPVAIPAGVKATIKDGAVSVTGPLGTLSFKPAATVNVGWGESEKSMTVSIDAKNAENRQAISDWGTTRATIANMVVGVTKGYEKSMEVVGVGWTAAVQGDKLKLVVGYANPILMTIPKGLKITVEKQIVRVAGPDKQSVGMFASNMRAIRKPEPYNGKGIKYTTEVIKRKQGKQFGS